MGKNHSGNLMGGNNYATRAALPSMLETTIWWYHEHSSTQDKKGTCKQVL